MKKNSKKRILHILNSNSYSGAENVVITIIEYMHENYECVYLSPNGTITQILSKRGIDYFPVNKLTVSSIRHAIRIINPDLIHAHDFRAGILSCMTGTKIPIINHLHNNSPWLKNFSLWTILYAACCVRFKSILTVSSSVMNEFIFGQYFKKKTEIIGNPIDKKKIQMLAAKSPVKNKSDIIFLGRLTPQKNPFFFLDIVKSIVEEKKNLTVAIVGDGELRSAVEKKINQYNIQDNVKLYGFQDNPYGLLKNSRVMCMPSLWEGFGLAAVEALSLGIPVICSGAGGLSDFINEDCGSICGQNLGAYHKEILKLLTDLSYHTAKSKAALTKAENLSNIEEYIEKIVCQYKCVGI